MERLTFCTRSAVDMVKQHDPFLWDLCHWATSTCTLHAHPPLHHSTTFTASSILAYILLEPLPLGNNLHEYCMRTPPSAKLYLVSCGHIPSVFPAVPLFHQDVFRSSYACVYTPAARGALEVLALHCGVWYVHGMTKYPLAISGVVKAHCFYWHLPAFADCCIFNTSSAHAEMLNKC